MGAARIMQILCAMYDLPKSLADTSRGEQQYRDINKAVTDNSEVSGLISQLEAYYDRVLANASESDEEQPDDEDTQSQFAPDVERFLTEMGERLEHEEEGDDLDDDEV